MKINLSLYLLSHLYLFFFLLKVKEFTWTYPYSHLILRSRKNNSMKSFQCLLIQVAEKTVSPVQLASPSIPIWKFNWTKYLAYTQTKINLYMEELTTILTQFTYDFQRHRFLRSLDMLHIYPFLFTHTLKTQQQKTNDENGTRRKTTKH